MDSLVSTGDSYRFNTFSFLRPWRLPIAGSPKKSCSTSGAQEDRSSFLSSPSSCSDILDCDVQAGRPSWSWISAGGSRGPVIDPGVLFSPPPPPSLQPRASNMANDQPTLIVPPPPFLLSTPVEKILKNLGADADDLFSPLGRCSAREEKGQILRPALSIALGGFFSLPLGLKIELVDKAPLCFASPIEETFSLRGLGGPTTATSRPSRISLLPSTTDGPGPQDHRQDQPKHPHFPLSQGNLLSRKAM